MTEAGITGQQVLTVRREYAMDIFSFINSKAIADHLRSIDYHFNALEAAWIVTECKRATLKEKHDAYREIIETMPDMAVEDLYWTVCRFSVHTGLRHMIDYEIKKAEEVMEIKDFSADMRIIDMDGYRHGRFRGFKSFDDMHQYIMTKLAEEGFLECSVECSLLDSDDKFEFALDPFGDFKRVSSNDDTVGKMMKFQIDHYGGFVFPTPFENGDILYDPSVPMMDHGYGPFVYEGHNTTQPEWLYNDRPDMAAWGSFIDVSGNLQHDIVSDYMSLEYYPEEELIGAKRVLKSLSNFEKGHIDIVLFARAYHQILCEEYAKSIVPYGYSKDRLQIAGITATRLYS